MQFPRPLGSYSVELSEEIQEEIQLLDTTQLKNLLSDITTKIANGDTDPFSTSCLHGDYDHMIDTQLENTNDWLGFLAWVLDGLKHAIN